MLDLLKQFFRFDKLMKDRLVGAFFYLGLVVIVISFWATLKTAFAAFGISFFSGLGFLFLAFFQILFFFIGLRLLCELMIAVFHINNNLAPDGGKSDTAEIDILETTREAAAKAAKSASVVTKSAIEKTKTRLAERERKTDEYPDYEDTPPPEVKKPEPKKSARKKPATKKATPKKTTAKKSTARKPATKKTGK